MRSGMITFLTIAGAVAAAAAGIAAAAGPTSGFAEAGVVSPNGLDKREPEAMAAYPTSRVESPDGVGAYTLYARPGAQPFMHALNTSDRVAHCIDLAGKGSLDDIGSARLTLSQDGKLLVVRSLIDGKTLLTVPTPR